MKVLQPRSFREALMMKADSPEAVPVAGGTDLFVHWPTNLDEHERTYLDLGQLAELRYINFDNGDLVIGAGTTYWDVLREKQCADHFPILCAAAKQIGAVQIQVRGTWAGNIGNASPAADGVAVLMACDAAVVLASVRGERCVPLHEFYTDYRKTIAEPDELIRSVCLPGRHYNFSKFVKVGTRRAQAITKVGAAVTCCDAGWRIVANSMAATVRNCKELQRLADSGQRVKTPEDLLAAVNADLRPIDDLRSTAIYRQTVFARIVFAMLQEHWQA